MTARFSLGIDLGTSNSAIAVSDLDAEETRIVEVAQLVGANQVGRRQTLASALYLPHPDEFPSGLANPFGEASDTGIVGQFAREHGALVPDRLITSAKSWLSNPHIDPKQALLPWGSEIETKLSPFEASRRYLMHLRHAFLQTEHEAGRDWDLADGQIVLTVPASFDEVARSLTAEAAREAGLGDVTLLEEPQAAFYSWTAQTGRAWHDLVQPGDIVLVCDVGGGTADFSLIAVTDVNGDLQLERISVGEHILLGGDNMDLALAYTIQNKLEDEGKTLDSWQFLSLVHSSARAKIALFEDAALSEAPIAVPSRGSSLFASTISTSLDRAMLEAVVLEGFLAKTPLDQMPEENRRGGLQEFGLPYASDPVVSKHIARFLVRSLQNVKASEKLSALIGDRGNASALMPTAVLFNGGVFKAAPIRTRVLELLASWNNGQPIRELQGAEPDLAVAYGAAVYGRHRATGKGMRIKAGVARSYYVGLESSGLAVPGIRPRVKALCVVPQGLEEGSDLLIEGREFGLVTGRPAEFRFFSSSIRSGDSPGQVLPDAERELEETSLLEIEIPALEDFPAGQVVPVRIDAVVTELGTLELWMKHVNSDRKWKVEFQVRTE
ncbi:MAG: Hsp70 family protein [Proteobacteria bacterium]|nr:Hsp70 family protein [Pseudomonadota bacterium]